MAPTDLQSLIRFLPGRVLVIDGAEKILYASAGSERLFGYPEESLKQKSISLLFPDMAGLESFSSIVDEKTDLRSEPQQAVLCGQCSDGRLLLLEVTIAPLPAGKESRLLLLLRDAAPEMEIMRELSSFHGRIAEMERMVRAGSWRWDSRTGRLQLSEEIYRILNLVPGEIDITVDLIGRMIPAGQLRDVKRVFVRALRGGKPFSFTLTAPHPDGHEMQLYINGRVLEDERGRNTRFRGTVQDITEFQRIQNELRRERDFSAAVLNTLTAVVVVLDPRGNIVDLNRAAEKLTGFDRAEVIGQPIFDTLIPHEERNEVRTVFRNIQAGDFPARQENGWLTRGGEIRLLDWSNTAIIGEDNRVEYVIGTGIDITERRRTERELARSNAEWSYALDFFEDGIVIAGMDDRIIRGNRSFFSLLEQKPEELIGHDIRTLLHRHSSGHVCRLCTIRSSGRDGHVTMEAEDYDNPFPFPAEMTLNVIRDDKSYPFGILTTIHDLRPSRITEGEIARLNRNIRLLMDSTQEGVLGIDSDGCCTIVNRAAAEMLCYSVEELSGSPLHDLIHYSHEDGEEYPIEECPIMNSIVSGENHQSRDDVFWRRDGSPFPVHYSATPILEQGKVSGAVVVFRNIEEERTLTRQMNFLAYHDPLTGLVNRRAFEERMRTVIDAARLDNTQNVFCYLDLDQFKIVNDSCGHVAGDELLRRLGKVLQSRVRRCDTLARLGGDEFGVLLERCNAEQALRVVRDLKAAIQKFRFIWDNRTFTIGVSIGIVEMTPENRSLDAVLRAADTACYLAKEKGRNRAHLFQPDDAEILQRHGELEWVSRIQEALEQNRFRLDYQPIMPINQSVNGIRLEVLLRMLDETGGVIPPIEFIPAAERFNLMSSLDRWVVNQAFDWLSEHKDLFSSNGFCAINLSGGSLADDRFLEYVQEELKRCDLDPALICFEITETAAISNLIQAQGFIQKLRESGCHFALDDFGTGMSSFEYLKNLPVDYLKIDGTFVRDMHNDNVDRAMVEAVNRIGHVMGLKTIAEFVENEQILELLAEIGVDFAQGFALAKPRPLSEYTR